MTNVDVLRSIQYVRGSVSKNINFGRPNSSKRRVNRNQANYRSYDYDMAVVRPVKKGLVDFGVGKGREEKMKT